MTEEFLLGEVKHGYYSLLTKAIVQSLSADEVEDVEDSEENGNSSQYSYTTFTKRRAPRMYLVRTS